MQDLALAAYQAGERQDARRLLRQLLSEDEACAAGYHLLGIMELEESSPLGALECFERALLLSPQDCAIHYNKGNALRSLGDYAQAIASYRLAIKCQSFFPEALNNLASILQLTGEHLAAVEMFESALAQRSDFPEALSGLGLALRSLGELVRAEEVLRQVIDRHPTFVEAYVNLGQLLQPQGRIAEAEWLYRQAMAIRSDYVEALNNLGTVFEQREQHKAARALYLQVLEIRPEYPEAIANLANTLQADGEPQAARSFYRRAIELNSTIREIHHNMGLSFQQEGSMAEAIACYTEALVVDSAYLESRWNRAVCLFHLGEYSTAWRDHEWRLQSRELKKLYAEPQLPRWDGDALAAGQSLLVVSEQGLGDTLQFIRYVRGLVERGLRVSVCIPDQLESILDHASLGVRLIKASEATSAGGMQADQWLPLMSLPMHLGINPVNPGVTDPYLAAAPEQVAQWQERLAAEKKPIIAINWQGNPDTERNNLKGRSLALDHFAGLAQRLPVTLLSLQKGIGSEQLSACSFRDRFVSCQVLVDQTWDFLETAAIIANCDLVITSDTAVAHLAAATGKPTWLLLQRIPDWRWGLEGESSFWYPSMRLFRQQRTGDWSEVFERVNAALADWGTERGFWLEPPPVPSPASSAAPSMPARLKRQLGNSIQVFWRWVENAEQTGPFEQAEPIGPQPALLPLAPSTPVAASAPQQRRLAAQLVSVGNLLQAEQLYETLHASEPPNAQDLSGLAVVCLLTGRPQRAIDLLQQAMQLRPDDAELLANLGAAHYQLGSPQQAAGFYRQALALNAALVEPFCGLARLALDQGRPMEAIPLYRQALELRAQHPEALNNLGLAFQQLQAYDLAAQSLRQALAMRPDYLDAIVNLGNNCQLQDDLAGAIDCYRRAVALQPGRRDAHFNLGLAHQQAGEFAAAIEAYSVALTLDLGDVSARWNRAACLLQVGDDARGWQDYACRLTSPQLNRVHASPSAPLWSGDPLQPGQRLLLIGEQGLGDVIQFIRYAISLAERGIQLGLCVPDSIRPLIEASSLPVDLLTPDQASTIRETPWIPLLSLPSVLDVSLLNPIVTAPYLRPLPGRVAYWQQQLAQEEGPVIAINWQGNPAAETSNLRGRSMPLERFAALLEDPAVSLLSLQKGVGAEQLPGCTFRDRFVACQEQVDQTYDFLELAAIIASCDLVITTDSVVAHLAGSIAHPTWLLLQHVPEWRWGLEGETTPWYPSLRLFRQRRRGDWADVMERVAQALKCWRSGEELPPSSRRRPSGIVSAFWDWIERSQAEEPVEEKALELREPSALDSVDLPWIKLSLASSCLRRGLHQEAERLYSELLGSSPVRHAAYAGLGASCLLANRVEEAVQWLSGSLAIKANAPEVISNLGTAYHRLGRLEDAKILYRQAIALKPDFADPHCNLACVLQEEGRIQAAIDLYREAIACRQDYAEAHWNLSMCLFLLGAYSEAWREHEWRLHDASSGKLHAIPTSPRWLQDELPGEGRLLLIAEQGLGDTLQFVRFIPLLMARGISVSLCSPAPLHGLIASIMPDVELLAPEQAVAWDSHPWMPLMSVPRFLGVCPERPIVEGPYLRSPASLQDAWRQRMAAEECAVVALHWQGNPSAEVYNLRGRSMPLEAFSPLAGIEGLRLLSLQKGFGSEQLLDCSFRDRFVTCQELVDQAWDFQEAAAIIASCDLLITSDSAVAHLAGAMGQETWLLLHHAPDWRWGCDGETTFWYPSLRLFRQRSQGEWAEVVARVVDALSQRIS
ncbi:MAG: tetratricopeptide repeat protein [Synechococcus sp.]